MSKMSASLHLGKSDGKTSNAIKTLEALKKVQRNNEREYINTKNHYDINNVSYVVGDGNLSETTNNFIQEKVRASIERFNENPPSKRSVLKNTDDDSVKNEIEKNLQGEPAVEIILGFGDKQSWDELKNYKKEYPKEYREACDDLLKRRVDLLNNLTESDAYRNEIIKRLESKKAEAEALIAKFSPEEIEDFERFVIHKKPTDADKVLMKEKSLSSINELKKEKITALRALLAVDETKYNNIIDYINAKVTIRKIDVSHQIEAWKSGNLHFKVMAANGHYDESHAHGHVVGVAYQEGYTGKAKGLDFQFKKTTVFNESSLEVLQEVDHAITKQWLREYQAKGLFPDVEFKEKEIGRTHYYSKGEYIQLQQQKAEAERANRIEQAEKNYIEFLEKEADDASTIVDMYKTIQKQERELLEKEEITKKLKKQIGMTNEQIDKEATARAATTKYKIDKNYIEFLEKVADDASTMIDTCKMNQELLEKNEYIEKLEKQAEKINLALAYLRNQAL